MFTLSDMRALLGAQPFMPFRLWLSDGRHLDIRSPEQVFPLRYYALIGLLDHNAIEESYDRHATIWYMHVTGQEALKPGASPFASSGEPPAGSPSLAAGS